MGFGVWPDRVAALAVREPPADGPRKSPVTHGTRITKRGKKSRHSLGSRATVQRETETGVLADFGRAFQSEGRLPSRLRLRRKGLSDRPLLVHAAIGNALRIEPVSSAWKCGQPLVLPLPRSSPATFWPQRQIGLCLRSGVKCCQPIWTSRVRILTAACLPLAVRNSL